MVAPTPKVTGINHITFICKDLEKTTRLFQGLFGAEEVYSSGDKTFSLSREKFFIIGGTWIAIMEGEPIEKTYNHVAFSVNEADLPHFEQEIKNLGLTLLPGRDRKQEGESQSLYFYDYDNHLFELHTGNLATRLAFYRNSNSSV